MIQSGTFWLILFWSVLCFWALPKKFRLGFLATVSFLYLATLEPVGMLVLLGWMLTFYWLAPYTQGRGTRQRWLLATLVLSSLGYLAYFKYIPPLLTALSLSAVGHVLLIPLGISYFTFKLIHYAVEVSRNNLKNHSLSQLFCYIFLFPIFTAGPIERFDHFLTHQQDHWQIDLIVEGLTRIIYGLIKKFYLGGVILVSLLGRYASDGSPNAGILLDNLIFLPTYEVWGFLVLTYLYTYIDFSAYSDIAIGASRLFGIRIMENFNFPILAPNIGNFWKRWHMTLGGWCQAYVYMPTIGFTRNPYLAVYSTMLAIGLWHVGSLNWACWGLYHATGIAIYMTWTRLKRQRQWFWLDHTPILRYWGVPVTFLFVSSAAAFTSIQGYGGLYSALRILAKLCFINLPA